MSLKLNVTDTKSALNLKFQLNGIFTETEMSLKFKCH